MERDEHFRCEWSQSICFCLLFVMDRFVSSDYWFSYFRRRSWSRPLGQFPSSFANHAFHFSPQSTIRSLVSSNSSSQPVQKRSPWKRKQGKAWQKRGSWGGVGGIATLSTIFQAWNPADAWSEQRLLRSWALQYVSIRQDHVLPLQATRKKGPHLFWKRSHEKGSRSLSQLFFFFLRFQAIWTVFKQ